jgi:hypothetical protein
VFHHVAFPVLRNAGNGQSLQRLGWVLFALNVLVPLDMAWMKRVAGSKPQQPAFG